jgi:hypothetical protein
MNIYNFEKKCNAQRDDKKIRKFKAKEKEEK